MIYIALALLSCTALTTEYHPQSSLMVYDVPQDAPLNNTYSVAVRFAGEEWVPLQAYDAVVDYAVQAHMSFVYFDSDFTKNIEVSVTKNEGTVTAVNVRPGSAGIESLIDGNTVFLTLTSPAKLSVEFNDDILHNLFIFAGQQEPDSIECPESADHYFGPGTHMIGDGTGTLELNSGERVYIAGGAIVYGNITASGVENVMISGRGILCGSYFDHSIPPNQPKPHMIFIHNSRNVTVSGIILLNTVGWNIPVRNCYHMNFNDLKIIGWTINSDGINPCASSNVTISDCFMRNSDDCISIKLGYAFGGQNRAGCHNILIRNSVLWTDQGRAVLIGPESYSTDDQQYDSVRVENIDILFAENYDPDWAKGVLAINLGDSAFVKNVTFRDIRVERLGEETSLINIHMKQTRFNKSPGRSIQNILFDHITLNTSTSFPNWIHGHDASRLVEGVEFINLKMDGDYIEDPAAGNFSINEYAKNIDFSVSGE